MGHESPPGIRTSGMAWAHATSIAVFLCFQAPGGDNAGECLATGATHQLTDNPSYILYDPQSNTLSDDVPFPLLASTWPFNLYPFLALLPGTESILVVSGNQVAVFVIKSSGWLPDTDWGLPVSLPIPVLYPMTAAITLLPLSAADSWQAQVGSHSIPGILVQAGSPLINTATQ